MTVDTIQPGWRDWLLSDRPQSRRQARLGRAYVTWRQFSANRLAVAGLLIIIALVLVAALADVIAPHSPVIGDLTNAYLKPPGTEGYLLGTDDLGRDILSRLIYGSRWTLYIVVLVAIISAPVGLIIGMVSGYMGGWIDTVLMRITDIFLAFPKLVLALAFAGALGAGIENAIIAIAITSWPPYARLARAETMTVRRSDYIAAVRLMGASPLRIIFRHVMPLCISSVIVRVTLDMAGVILTAAGLGFLGPRRATATAGMGGDDRHRVQILPRPMVGGGYARHRHPDRQPRLQPARRRTARCARSEGERPMTALLTVENLRVRYPTRTGVIEAVRGVSFTLGRERLGIVGESGFRQIADWSCHHGAHFVAWNRHRRPAEFQWHRPPVDLREGAPVSARQTHRHGASGSEIFARPGDDHRPADHRDAAHA